MRTKVSTRGQIKLPSRIRNWLNIRPGAALDISIEGDRIVLTAPQKKSSVARIIEDPISGLPVLDAGPDAPILTSEMVRKLLVDFP